MSNEVPISITFNQEWFDVSEVETGSTLGYEWRLSDAGIDGAVMVNSSAGMLVLCRIEQWQRGLSGGYRAVPVKATELERLP